MTFTRLNLLALGLAGLVLTTHARAERPIMGLRLGEPFAGQFQPCYAGPRLEWCTRGNSELIYPPDDDAPEGLPTWVKREPTLPEISPPGVVESFLSLLRSLSYPGVLCKKIAGGRTKTQA